MTNQDLTRRFGRTLMLLSVVLSAAVIPLLPPIVWKVKGTVLAALLLAAALYVQWRSGSLDRSPLDLPAGTFLAVAVLATAVSVDRLVSFYPSPLRGEGLIVYAGYVAAALAAARVKGREIGAVIAVVLLSGSLLGGVALAQYYGVDLLQWAGFASLSLPAYWEHGSGQLLYEAAGPAGRSAGSLGNSMFLGAYAALLIPVGAALTVRAGRRAWGAYAGVTTVLYGALLASQSRTAWIASVVAAFLLLYLLPRSRMAWGRAAWRRVAVLGAGCAALTAVMVFTRPQLALPGRAASTIAEFGPGRSLGARLYLWKHTLPLIGERPLLGWGFSALLGRWPDLGSLEYRKVFGDEAVYLIDNPHNELLHLTYSTGLAGLAAYLWVWTTVAIVLVRMVRRNVMPPLGAALAASLAAYAIWMQTGWSHIGLANIFWTVLGLAAALGATSDDRSRFRPG